ESCPKTGKPHLQEYMVFLKQAVSLSSQEDSTSCSYLADVKDEDSYFSVILCRIIPPRALYLPVLPYRCQGKLMFSYVVRAPKICNKLHARIVMRNDHLLAHGRLLVMPPKVARSSIGALPRLPLNLNQFDNRNFLNILYKAENLVRKQESLTFKNIWFFKTGSFSQQPRRFY
ncbi:hypothetical protein CEXT_494541, partial [Caerostris extrusa]